MYHSISVSTIFLLHPIFLWLLFIAQVTSAPLVSQVQPNKPKPDFLNVAVRQNFPLKIANYVNT